MFWSYLLILWTLIMFMLNKSVIQNLISLSKYFVISNLQMVFPTPFMHSFIIYTCTKLHILRHKQQILDISIAHFHVPLLCMTKMARW
jgi:hypothetical protein